jgi:hypothetical protein
MYSGLGPPATPVVDVLLAVANSIYKMPPNNINTAIIIAVTFLKNDSPKLVPLNSDRPLSAVELKNPPTVDAPETDASLIAVNVFDTFSIIIILNPIT